MLFIYLCCASDLCFEVKGVLACSYASIEKRVVVFEVTEKNGSPKHNHNS